MQWLMMVAKFMYLLVRIEQAFFLIEIIEPESGKITVLKDHLIPRRYFSAVWDGKHSIYILGGVSLEGTRFRFEKRVEVFNTITHKVSFVEQLPAPTRINSAVYLDGNIFVLGGTYSKLKKLTATPMVAKFNVASNKWEQVADMPTAKSTQAIVKDGFIYAVGGYNHMSSLNAFERFDPVLNQWQSLPEMPAKVSAHSVTLVDEKLYVFGNYRKMKSTYSYDFLTAKWKKIDIGYKKSRHNAATTLNGTTYVIGGNTGSNGPFLDYIQTFNLQ